MTRLALIAATLLIAVGSVGVLAQDETTPTSPEIELQTVEVGDRSYEVDPFYLVDCTLIRRVEEVPTTGEEGLTKAITAQCFYRDEDGQMVPWGEFQSVDQGITEGIEVRETLISEPRVAQDDPLDG